MRPPAALLDQLSVTRLLPAQARPSVGIGERRSRRKGPGMEFLDHRPHREGDDTRHLDPYVLARSGEKMIREYAASRQIPVTVLIDGSGSMTIGDGGKHRLACLIAQALGFVALAGGDRAQVAVGGDEALHWSPRWQGAARADDLFAWITAQPKGGRGDFGEALRAVREYLPPAGLLVAISDWWGEGLEDQLDTLFAASQEVIAVQILAPDELAPDRLGRGVITVIDAETEDEVEVAIDADTLRRYAAMLAEWRGGLRGIFASRQWHFFSAEPDTDIGDFCLRTLRGAGVLS